MKTIHSILLLVSLMCTTTSGLAGELTATNRPVLELNSSLIDGKSAIPYGEEPNVALSVRYLATPPVEIVDFFRTNHVAGMRVAVSVDGKKVAFNASMAEARNRQQKMIGLVLMFEKRVDAERVSKALRSIDKH